MNKDRNLASALLLHHQISSFCEHTTFLLKQYSHLVYEHSLLVFLVSQSCDIVCPHQTAPQILLVWTQNRAEMKSNVYGY